MIANSKSLKQKIMKWTSLKLAIRKIYQLGAVEALQQAILFYFMPGAYRREWIDNDIKMEETIQITRLNNSASLYRITKKVMETYYIEDKLMNITKEETFYAAYSNAAKVLLPTGWDEILLFYPEDNLLIIENLEYKKLDL
jgi:hypothetical protein